MLLSAVSDLVVAQSSLEIPEGPCIKLEVARGLYRNFSTGSCLLDSSCENGDEH